MRGARSAIREALDDDRLLGLQYSPFGGHTVVRRKVADAFRGTHGLDFTFRDVILTSGAMAALHIALRMAARADGEVIVPVPCWIDHPLYVRAIGLSPVLVPLARASFDLDVGRDHGCDHGADLRNPVQPSREPNRAGVPERTVSRRSPDALERRR